jgi:hypothetical protein
MAEKSLLKRVDAAIYAAVKRQQLVGMPWQRGPRISFSTAHVTNPICSQLKKQLKA